METKRISLLKQKNEFPIIFIGAGMSKRFLQGYPSWEELLELLWKEALEENFYGKLNLIRDEILKEKPEIESRELNHLINIKMGTIIESKFNHLFYNEKIMIDGFTTKDAFHQEISPLKVRISQLFATGTLIEGKEHEYEMFKKMLAKSQIILTTNYDDFIEKSYNESSPVPITKFIGQKGFFSENYGYSELFKLHGCIEAPVDIILSEKDYEKFEKNSNLISAKVISLMLKSPIIFLGYSLTDLNVRKIIKDLTSSLNENELEILEKRMILIERKEGEQSFEEITINDSDLGCKLSVIRTDNYAKIFEEISKINQGLAPSEVRRYYHVMRELVVDRGKKGALKSLLIAPEGLEAISKNIENSNVVIGFGDDKYIFQIPDLITYCYDYISESFEINTDISLRFILLQNGNARVPASYYLKDELIEGSTLHPTEKQKLRQRKERLIDFEKHYSAVVDAQVILHDAENLGQILSLAESVNQDKLNETISSNINRLNMNEVKEFILKILDEKKATGDIHLSTTFRRLILLYDLKKGY